MTTGTSFPARQFALFVTFDPAYKVHPQRNALVGAIGIPDGTELHGFNFFLQDQTAGKIPFSLIRIEPLDRLEQCLEHSARMVLRALIAQAAIRLMLTSK